MNEMKLDEIGLKLLLNPSVSGFFCEIRYLNSGQRRGEVYVRYGDEANEIQRCDPHPPQNQMKLPKSPRPNDSSSLESGPSDDEHHHWKLGDLISTEL